MTLQTKPSSMVPDEQLWQKSRAGDREAFGQIVERYQSLICSLAYSACGDLSRSEDLAQDTFVTAWRRLGELREPAKLRAWLCGIVRNLAANAWRREQRRAGPAEFLDIATEREASEKDPAAQTVTREEAALLWRSLSGLSEVYREPMVLFYRQGRSITEVARMLELSEDAVKKRLSRGRELLRDELADVVESTLVRTIPGTAFTVGVLVALPMVSGSSASAALVAGAVAGSGPSLAGKGVLAKLGLGALFGPIIGLTCAYLGTQAAASTARSGPERSCILRYARWIIAFCFALSLGLAAVLSQAGKLYSASAAGIVIGVAAWIAVLLGGILFACRRMDEEARRIRIETNTTDEAYSAELAAAGRSLRRPKYFETKLRLLGLPLVALAWGSVGSDAHRARAVCGWVAVGDIAISPFLAFGGVAVAPIAIGGITVGVLSLSLWGIAVGMLAVGSLAFGWWALGFAAAGVKGAVGFAAVARDYAVGIAASAAEVGTTAADWVRNHWLTEFVELIVDRLHWWLLGSVALALLLGLRRARQEGREAQSGEQPARH